MRFCRSADPWGCASHSQDWSLTDDELETVMQRLDDALNMVRMSALFTTLFVD